jgi:hypothetical protein
MGIDVWLKTDIENILRATAFMAVEMTREIPDTENEAFLRGFRAALTALALAFGLPEASNSLPPPMPEERRFIEEHVWRLSETKVIGSQDNEH